MKKLFFILSLSASIFLPSAGLIADSDPDGPHMGSAERKAALKALVETRENGDIVIARNPASDYTQRIKSMKVPDAVMEMMLHVDSNLDLKKFEKAMNKHVNPEDVRIRESMKACDEYLSSMNMGVRRINKFSAANIRTRINVGIPYFIAIYNKEGWEKPVIERTQKRPADGEMKGWKETLRKEALKGSRGKIIGKIDWCLIWGYNRDTGEFLVNRAGEELWMTESELKLFHHSVYELK